MPFVGRSDVKDPGVQQDQWDRLARRRERLYIDDEQFRHTRPDEEIAAAARAPGLRIAEVMATVLQGYADRPALGQRAREVITDHQRPGARHCASYRASRPSATRTCGRVSKRWPPTGTITTSTRCAPGTSCVCWDSPASTTQRSNAHAFAPSALSWCRYRPAHRPRSTPRSLTRPSRRIFAVGIDNLRDCRRGSPDWHRAGPPDRLRLRTARRWPTRHLRGSAHAGSADSESSAVTIETIETIDDVVAHGKSALRPPPLHVAAPRRRPAGLGVLLLGHHRDTQGRNVHRKSVHRNVARAIRSAGHHVELHADESSDRLWLRVILTLANGGTSYFAAKSDLSTLFEDLALVRPTSMSLVPRVCEMFFHPLSAASWTSAP